MIAASTPQRCRAVFWIGLMTLLLTGCSASAPVKLYMLAPQPAGAQVEKFTGTVAVKPVALPKYLDQLQIARFISSYELSASDYERWAENLDEIVTRILIADLALRLPRGHVVASSGPLTMPADATVEIDIQRFDAGPARSVVLTAQWIVRRERRQGQGRLRSEEVRVTAASDSAPDLAAAMSDALGQLSDRIAVTVAE
jgi:uncharacterized protein